MDCCEPKLAMIRGKKREAGRDGLTHRVARVFHPNQFASGLSLFRWLVNRGLCHEKRRGALTDRPGGRRRCLGRGDKEQR